MDVKGTTPALCLLTKEGLLLLLYNTHHACYLLLYVPMLVVNDCSLIIVGYIDVCWGYSKGRKYEGN